MSVSVIIPAYNEQARLPATLAATADYFAGRAEAFDILVVDDGSRDATAQVVADFIRARPEVPTQCLSYGGNRAKGMPCASGCCARRASCDCSATPTWPRPRKSTKSCGPACGN